MAAGAEPAGARAPSPSISTAVARSWRHPGQVVRGLLAKDRREGRLMMYLTLALGIVFVAQLPRLTRIATDEVGFEPLMAGALFGIMFVGPLLAYALALVLVLVLRPFGAVEPFAVRLALFWALLATAPLVLAQAALVALTGPGVAATLSGIAVLAGFAAILIAGLRVARAEGAA